MIKYNATATLLLSADHRLAAKRVRDEIAAMPDQATAVALIESLPQNKRLSLAD
jgi:hypothetical protein